MCRCDLRHGPKLLLLPSISYFISVALVFFNRVHDRGVGSFSLSSDMAQSPLVNYIINKKVLLLDPNE